MNKKILTIIGAVVVVLVVFSAIFLSLRTISLEKIIKKTSESLTNTDGFKLRGQVKIKGVVDSNYKDLVEATAEKSQLSGLFLSAPVEEQEKKDNSDEIKLEPVEMEANLDLALKGLKSNQVDFELQPKLKLGFEQGKVDFDFNFVKLADNVYLKLNNFNFNNNQDKTNQEQQQVYNIIDAVSRAVSGNWYELKSLGSDEVDVVQEQENTNKEIDKEKRDKALEIIKNSQAVSLSTLGKRDKISNHKVLGVKIKFKPVKTDKMLVDLMKLVQDDDELTDEEIQEKAEKLSKFLQNSDILVWLGIDDGLIYRVNLKTKIKNLENKDDKTNLDVDITFDVVEYNAEKIQIKAPETFKNSDELMGDVMGAVIFSAFNASMMDMSVDEEDIYNDDFNTGDENIYSGQEKSIGE